MRFARPAGAWAPFLFLTLVLGAACAGQPFTMTASGPFSDPVPAGASIERIAVYVSIRNHAGDDLQIDPAEFVARDADRRVYRSNPAAASTDAREIAATAGLRGTLPLPAMTLRAGDQVSGFVLFDVPAGVLPTECIWRQVDVDTVVALTNSPS
jgi:hypothetical protein